jgi:hypothetical protein
VKKVKGRVVSFSILTLLIMLVAVLAMASSAKACTIFPASAIAIGPPTVTDISETTLPSGLIVGSAHLVVPDLLTIGTKGYTATSISTWTWVINPYTKWAQSRFDGSLQVGSPTNGFRYYYWSFVITEYGYDVSTMAYKFGTVQVVSYGFGSFAGDTLVLHYAGTNVLFGTWTGYVIKPWR